MAGTVRSKVAVFTKKSSTADIVYTSLHSAKDHLCRLKNTESKTPAICAFLKEGALKSTIHFIARHHHQAFEQSNSISQNTRRNKHESTKFATLRVAPTLQGYTEEKHFYSKRYSPPAKHAALSITQINIHKSISAHPPSPASPTDKTWPKQNKKSTAKQSKATPLTKRPATPFHNSPPSTPKRYQ